MRRMRIDPHPLDPGSAQQIAALEARVRELTQQLQEFKDEGQRNEALLRKMQQRELTLLRAGSLAELMERIISGLRLSYQLDAVGLVLLDPQHEIRHLLAGDGLVPDELSGVQFVDVLQGLAPQLASLEKPWLGRYRKADHELLLPGITHGGSVALVPLSRGGQLDGVLVFCSADGLRFRAGLGTDFLAHLGVVAALCIENAVNRARLVRSGLTDFLTGFHNRRYLHARLREELARAQRSHQPLACLMIDIDHFKRINDQYGHLAGDTVLREVAQRIEGEMRTSDTGARFGGDEFAMVLAPASLADGERVAERILQAVGRDPVAVGAMRETITLSIGVAAAAPADGPHDFKALAEGLIAQADAALYRAKGAGRNQVAVGGAEAERG